MTQTLTRPQKTGFSPISAEPALAAGAGNTLPSSPALPVHSFARLRMTDSEPLQRCACEEEAQRTEFQRKETSQEAGGEDLATADVSGVVSEGLASGGRPLDPDTRAFMEPRFGHDFSQVRVHDNPQASSSAQSVAARAYTVGSNIAFRSGEFAPGSGEGRRLLAHELTHVVQQGAASPLAPGVQRSLWVSQMTGPNVQRREVCQANGACYEIEDANSSEADPEPANSSPANDNASPANDNAEAAEGGEAAEGAEVAEGAEAAEGAGGIGEALTAFGEGELAVEASAAPEEAVAGPAGWLVGAGALLLGGLALGAGYLLSDHSHPNTQPDTPTADDEPRDAGVAPLPAGVAPLPTTDTSTDSTANPIPAVDTAPDTDTGPKTSKCTDKVYQELNEAVDQTCKAKENVRSCGGPPGWPNKNLSPEDKKALYQQYCSQYTISIQRFKDCIAAREKRDEICPEHAHLHGPELDLQRRGLKKCESWQEKLKCS